MLERPYLVLGSRPWIRPVFDDTIARLPGRWLYLDDPSKLTEEHVDSIAPSVIFLLHWSTQVPAGIVARYECVGFHMTDLPYGRGGSPLQNLIQRGHTSTMLTAFRLTTEWDAGPVFMKRPLNLEGRAHDIYIRATRLAADMIAELIAAKLQPLPQVGEAVVFARRKPAQSEIPKLGSLQQLYDFIRMLDADGYPRAFLNHLGFRVEFREASVSEGSLETRVVVTRPQEPQ